MLGASAKAGVGAAGLALVGCGDDDDDDDAAEPRTIIRAKFGFPFGAPFAGLLPEPFVAMGMGYFEEEGFRNEIIYQTALLPLIAGGAIDYARLTPVNAMNAFVAGQLLTVVFQNTYPFIFTIAVPADSPITEFSADALRGETIGITEFEGGEVPMVRSLLAGIGLKEGEDVELLPTSGTTPQPTIDALNTGKIVAFAGSIFDIGFLEVSGFPMRDISPDEVKSISADDAIGVRADFLRARRDEVVAYCRALAKGTIFTLENSRAAAVIGLEFAPDSGPVDEVVEFIELFLNDRATPPAGIRLGEVPQKGWNEYQAFLLRGGTGSPVDPLAFTEPFDTAVIIDNSLVPEIWGFDEDRIRKDARDFPT